MSALLAFLGSLVYGASDFFGGLAAGRMSSIRVTAINSVAGVLLLSVASWFIPGRWSVGSVVFGGLAGAAGAVALGLLYACLALGPMSILAPIMALVSAIVPIGVGFAAGERLTAIGYLGLLGGLTAVILICLVPGARTVRPGRRGILMAVGAGIAVGLYLVFINLTPGDSGISPLIVTFAVAGLATGAILLGQLFVRRMTRRQAPPSLALSGTAALRSPAALAVYSGLTDAGACVLFLVALRIGDLSVVSVLNALSPAGTILLAALVLKERIAPVQWIGLALALCAAAMLAVA